MSTPTDAGISTSTLEVQARLSDIRTRVLAGGRVSAAVMRELLDDLRRDRDNTRKVAAKVRTAAKRAAPGAQGAQGAQPSFDLETAFSQ